MQRFNRVFVALAAKGVEVVKADLNEPATLAPVMEDAYGVFGVTDCTSHSPLSTLIAK